MNINLKIHKPVLLYEAIQNLNVEKEKIYVDCTLGFGGHSLEILKILQGNGILIGIEQDKDTFKIAKENLKEYKNCYLFNTNFIEIKAVLKELGLSKVHGVLMDLGVNSMQLSEANRGFSFQHEGPLDMRMDVSSKLKAYDVINKYSEKDLADIIYKYGEERFSRRIASNIVKNRPINSTLKLSEIVSKSIKTSKKPKINPATRTFQAIRIFVNNELENLENILCIIPELLMEKGRLTVISFHSLEDRIVKHSMRGNESLKVLTKKPILPTSSETSENPRARSAKLRVAEKTNENIQ